MKPFSFYPLLLIVFILVFFNYCFNQTNEQNNENEDSIMLHEEKLVIQEVIETAYIQGIHGNQDIKKIKTGFHKYFNMLVLKDNSIEFVNIDDWLKRIKKMKRENPVTWNLKTTHNLLLLDVTKDSAVAKLEVYKGDNHFSTDYMLLYKFKDGWKIVSKIYSVPK